MVKMMVNIFRLRGVITFAILGIVGLLLGFYMIVFGEVPAIGTEESLITLVGIDRLMCIYPLGLGLVFCYKAKHLYEDNLSATN